MPTSSNNGEPDSTKSSSSISDDTVLVGLTGSIGAGKSTVADLFEEAGIPVLRADLIARELMAEDPSMRASIIETFGPEAYNGDEVNRAWLAQQVFSDEARLTSLNQIVHPRTIAAQGVRARKLFDAGARIVACEAALIFETDGDGRFDYIVVVDAEPSVRYERASERDGASIEDIKRRDEMQMSAQHKAERADFVIKNNDGLDKLKSTTSFIVSLLKSLPPRDRLEVDDESASAEGYSSGDDADEIDEED